MADMDTPWVRVENSCRGLKRETNTDHRICLDETVHSMGVREHVFCAIALERGASARMMLHLIS